MTHVNVEGLYSPFVNSAPGTWWNTEADQSLCSIAYADPEPGKNDMTVCPVFFKKDNPESKNNLDSRHMHAPENTRPSRKGGASKEYWCEADKNIKWYEVAAQHLLHEMTHFDSAGKQAGFPEFT